MTHVMTSRESNPNFMNGVPELLILRLLEDAEMYGYEIVQKIRERTDSVIVVGEEWSTQCCMRWSAPGH
jgi:PadR family transcriptional regulator PadR